MKYQHVIAEALKTPWALRPSVLQEYAALLAFRASGGRLSDDEITARIKAGQEKVAARGGGARVGDVAVMPIIGTFLSRASAMQDVSATSSTQQMEAAFKALVADESIGAVVLDFDTPGGEVGGVAQFSDTVFNARGKKPIIGIASPQAASAGYWIFSSVDHGLVVPDGEVGSIGVWTMHQNLAKFLEDAGIGIELIQYGEHKTEGHPFGPLTDEARAFIKKRVDEYGRMFDRDVARGRGVSQATVRDSFGGGRMFGAEEAVKLGMADAVGTLDDAIALAAKRAKSKAARAEGGGRIVARADLETPAPVVDQPDTVPAENETAPDREPAAVSTEGRDRLRSRLRVAEAARR